MKVSDQTYLFDSLDSKVPNSSRKVYIRRVADILQMSIHRHDWPRAKRAWSILVRCPDFKWKKMWRTGLLILQYADSSTELRCLEYLRMMMLQSPEHRVAILQEIILLLIKSDCHQEALDELELYLPSLPYQDDAVLHIYAGLLCLFLAQPQRVEEVPSQREHAMAASSSGHISLKQAYVRDCRTHLRRATDLDPNHPLPSEILSRLSNLNAEEHGIGHESDGASDVTVDTDDDTKPSIRERVKSNTSSDMSVETDDDMKPSIREHAKSNTLSWGHGLPSQPKRPSCSCGPNVFATPSEHAVWQRVRTLQRSL